MKRTENMIAKMDIWLQ